MQTPAHAPLFCFMENKAFPQNDTVSAILLLLVPEVETIKPGLLSSAYSACAEDMNLPAPQNTQDKGVAHYAIRPTHGWVPPWDSGMRKGGQRTPGPGH